MKTDAFTQEVIKDALVAIGYEMFEAMLRTAMSPIIYETTDFAVGVTDAGGNLIAQGNGVAGFLATLDTAVQATLEHFPSPGDVCPGRRIHHQHSLRGWRNASFRRGILVPVFHGARLDSLDGEQGALDRGRWRLSRLGVDGGDARSFRKGSSSPSSSCYEGGRINAALVAMIRANVRLPESTIGDMHAGVAAAKVGRAPGHRHGGKYGVDTVVAAMESLARLRRAHDPRGIGEIAGGHL